MILIIYILKHNYDAWFENEESTDQTRENDEAESDMPPLEVDEEEVKVGKGLKILTPNKSLTRLSILLAKIKTGNNSYKLKNEIRQILCLLYQHNNVTKKFYNNLIKLL